jgi:hypothetical protein
MKELLGHRLVDSLTIPRHAVALLDLNARATKPVLLCADEFAQLLSNVRDEIDWWTAVEIFVRQLGKGARNKPVRSLEIFKLAVGNESPLLRIVFFSQGDRSPSSQVSLLEWRRRGNYIRPHGGESTFVRSRPGNERRTEIRSCALENWCYTAALPSQTLVTTSRNFSPNPFLIMHPQHYRRKSRFRVHTYPPTL